MTPSIFSFNRDKTRLFVISSLLTMLLIGTSWLGKRDKNILTRVSSTYMDQPDNWIVFVEYPAPAPF